MKRTDKAALLAQILSGDPAAIERLKAHVTARFTKIEYYAITDSELLAAFDLGVKLDHKRLSSHQLNVLIAHIESKLLQDESKSKVGRAR